MPRLLGVAALAAVLLATAGPPPATREPSFPFCQVGQAPQFLGAVRELQEQLGETMGEPLECEHLEPETGDVIQRTTTGLAFYRLRTGTPSFTNGFDRWALVAGSLVHWQGESVDPPVAMDNVAAVLVGAGDIAGCATEGDEATAALLDRIGGTVFTLGDNAYHSGTAREFGECYNPTWGRHKVRTRPAPGNHDYGTRRAWAYHQYFGAAAGEPGKGYYSYDVGDWHVVVINSNCGDVGGCQAGSPQERWLRADLAADPAPCTLAYWHHPRFSSGPHSNSESMQAIWQALYETGAEVVLAGHDHLYERFAPQDPSGQADPERGVRQFTVGTGGRSLYRVKEVKPNSEVRNDDSFGLLKLSLYPTSYAWEFIPVDGKTFSDAGNDSCH